MKKTTAHIILFLCLSAGMAAQGVKVVGPADLVFAGSPTMVIRDGGLKVLGNYHHDTETVIFSGTVADSIMANTLLMYNLSITNSGGIFDTVAVLTLNNLSIGATGLFTISDGSAATVSGTLSNSGSTNSLVVHSTAAGTGSLITSNDGVPLTVERYMTANQWHIVSPAASGIDIPIFLQHAANAIPTKDTDYAMTQYSEAGGGWDAYYNTSTTGSLSPGEAYLLRRTNDGATIFAGNSKATTTQVSISRSANGWNGVGNPFSSSIKVRGDVPGTDNFLGVNATALDPSYAALYIYDPATPTYYKIINNSETGGRYIDHDYLQAGQGFLIKSDVGGGAISFTHEMKFHQSASHFYKKTAEKNDWFPLDIKITSGESKATTLLLFNERMTPGLDITYDAGLMGGDADFKTYTLLAEDNGINFAIQCLPHLYPDQIAVPVGVDFTAGGELTISIRSETLPEGYIFVLEDKLNDTFSNLTLPVASYQATMEPNSAGADRFILHIHNENSITGKEAFASTTPEVSVFSYGKTVFIDGITDNGATAEIIDLSGRIATVFTPEPFGRHTAHLGHLPDGHYVIRIRETGKVYTQQLFLYQ